mmetsp:Transcript_19865/g.28254  ORF Transcript_19865/g.28254 Transcript_19865/m.28254 type:complete len:83 (+) Transcript_19865:53-301(+)
MLRLSKKMATERLIFSRRRYSMVSFTAFAFLLLSVVLLFPFPCFSLKVKMEAADITQEDESGEIRSQQKGHRQFRESDGGEL